MMNITKGVALLGVSVAYFDLDISTTVKYKADEQAYGNEAGDRGSTARNQSSERNNTLASDTLASSVAHTLCYTA